MRRRINANNDRGIATSARGSWPKVVKQTEYEWVHLFAANAFARDGGLSRRVLGDWELKSFAAAYCRCVDPEIGAMEAL